jgi:hypothetical protein
LQVSFLWVIVTFIPPELAMWMYGGSCSKLVQVVSYGQGHHRCTIYLYFFLLRFNSQPRKNMLGYPPRLRLHLGWLIILL